MKKSEIFLKNNEDLRVAVLSEISSQVRQHEGLKLIIDFEKSIAYSCGHDQEDEAQLIENVTQTHAIIYHQGNLMESKKLSELSTDMLIQIVGGLEKSLEKANVTQK